jgi:hypothetical protein
MTEKLTLRPDFAFKPTDFIRVDDDAKQVAPAAPAMPAAQVRAQPTTPKQAELPLKPREEAPPAPWEGANARVIVPYCYRMSEGTHAKVKWVSENVPGCGSIQKVIDKAVLQLVESLLKQHYPGYRG